MKLIGFSWKQDAVNGHQSLSNELELVSELHLQFNKISVTDHCFTD